MPFPFKDEALKTYLAAEKVTLMPQQQYFDSYKLDARGVTAVSSSTLKKKLGFAEVQKFDKTTLDAVRRVASTSTGDDCGEGQFEITPVQAAYASSPVLGGWQRNWAMMKAPVNWQP
jgi:hypothetical protein